MADLCEICRAPLPDKDLSGCRAANGGYGVRVCGNCGVGVTVPQPTPETLAALYETGAYRSKGGKRFIFFVEAVIYLFRQMRKRKVKRYASTAGDCGSLLDVGCGRGLFLNVMKDNGWSVAGVEFDSATACNVSEAYNIECKWGEPRQWGLPDASFDVITINHVLEHVRNPLEVISTCNRLLKDGGCLIVAVPNFSSLQARLGRGCWFHLDTPYHLYHFSEKGLMLLLREASMTVRDVNHFDAEYSPFGWLQTLLNLTGIRKNLLYNILKNQEARKRELTAVTGKAVALNFMLLPFFAPAAVILALYESFIARRGGTIEVIAVKDTLKK
ncbi:SAM-dependent methyltransferase [Candidatus Magnetobacterium bavaricum]|uniref:SAM-dependent methyltransferase n=1 Tax=Candidatus Magnetobacterium bavaricum TaxID=29290 RepID=A0A0F3GMP4_9BACT|nr:SAM-dependent methyltransferase [Candidatus Magnetobacterium bavaricum]